jgi:hypothetical protein
MVIVPLQPIPNQTLSIGLGGQSCTINVYQQAYGLYFDLYIGTNPIVLGIIGLNYNLIIRNAYFGFSGDFAFFDSQGDDDPVYTGLTSRWFLAYVTADELAALNLPAGVA